MKLPKLMIPKKDFTEKIDGLLKEPQEKCNTLNLYDLKESCEEFMEKNFCMTTQESYKLGVNIAKKMMYNKYDLEELSKEKVFEEYYGGLGTYFSALVNKIIREKDVISVRFNRPLHNIGAYLGKGTLWIEEGAGNFAGYGMYGGKLIIENDLNHCAGMEMHDGVMVIKGNAGYDLGMHMRKEGTIMVEGEIDKISATCKGRIYQKNKLVW